MTMLGSPTMVHSWRRRPDGSHDLLTHHTLRTEDAAKMLKLYLISLSAYFYLTTLSELSLFNFDELTR